GAAADTLTGGEGADTFSYGSFDGDTITDFGTGADRIHITVAGVSFADLAIAGSGSDTTVTWDGGHLTLTGVAHTDLTAADFIFTEAPAEPEPEEGEPAETPAEPEAPAEVPAKSSYVAVARIPESTDGFNVVDGRNPAEVTGTQELIGINRKDWIRGSDGRDVIRGNSGRDYIEGSGGNDFLSGGNARDWLNGGRGGDRLQGGKQDDILTGGTGRDTFVFKAKHGGDIVTDFAVGKDTLELHGVGADGSVVEFSDLTIKKWAKGTGARVEWDEGTIYLEGVQRDALTEDSFEFV
ncbi:MAG: hypothetical protein GDA53_09935, partial [Rhodobacteraceae bacterium]|nr:hypothetical protein [Paracoccaceae bacterium]